MELSSEMVTTYPGADEASRVRPLRCVLCKSTNLTPLTSVVSSVRQLEPIDPEHPRDFYVEYETATGWKRSHISVDTEVRVFFHGIKLISVLAISRAMETGLPCCTIPPNAT